MLRKPRQFPAGVRLDRNRRGSSAQLPGRSAYRQGRRELLPWLGWTCRHTVLTRIRFKMKKAGFVAAFSLPNASRVGTRYASAVQGFSRRGIVQTTTERLRYSGPPDPAPPYTVMKLGSTTLPITRPGHQNDSVGYRA